MNVLIIALNAFSAFGNWDTNPHLAGFNLGLVLFGAFLMWVKTK